MYYNPLNRVPLSAANTFSSDCKWCLSRFVVTLWNRIAILMLAL